MHTEATQLITDTLFVAGADVYFVGGCVRDAFMKIEPKDRDLLVTNMTVERIIELLTPIAKIDLVGASFGVLKVTLAGETVDVALPRTERSFGAGHRDFEIVADPKLSVQHDLIRRDFTMNAIAMHAVTGRFVDPLGGQGNIKANLIVAVGDADTRFTEDPLRMLRAVRFAAKLGFTIETDTFDAIVRLHSLIGTIAKERVYDEMCKILMVPDASHVADAIVNMHTTGILGEVIPEWGPCVGLDQRSNYHDLTVDNHVLKALRYAVDRGATLRARWAVLLHDIAKPMTFTLDEKGNGHFYKHEAHGAAIAMDILTTLRAPADMIAGVGKIVEEHLRPDVNATDRVLRRFVAEMGELTGDALMCREADVYAHIHGEDAPHAFDKLRERINGFAEIQGFTEAKLALNGHDIAALFGVKGRDIGKLKKIATDAVVEGLVKNEHDAIMSFLQVMMCK